MVGVRSPQKSSSTPLSRLVPVTRGRSSPRASARARCSLMRRLDSPVTAPVSAANPIFCSPPGVGEIRPPSGCSASQIAFLRLMACARCEAGCSGPGPRRGRSACGAAPAPGRAVWACRSCGRSFGGAQCVRVFCRDSTPGAGEQGEGIRGREKWGALLMCKRFAETRASSRFAGDFVLHSRFSEGPQKRLRK